MFKRSTPKESTPEIDELRQLLAAARQEGERLLALSGRLTDQGTEIQAIGRNAARIEKSLADASTKFEAVESRLGRLEAAARGVAELDSLVQVLSTSVMESNAIAERLIAPDGELQKQRQTAQQLSSHALQTRALLDTLKADQERLEKLRPELTQAVEEVQKARTQAAALTSETAVVRGAVEELTKEQQAIREVARDARDDAAAAASKVYEVDQKLTSLARLQDLARTLDERIVGLKATVEHVTQRSKVLDQQKHTVERAIIDGHRLAGMITGMEAQISRLEEGRRQAAAVEDTVDRIEAMVRESEIGRAHV